MSSGNVEAEFTAGARKTAYARSQEPRAAARRRGGGRRGIVTFTHGHREGARVKGGGTGAEQRLGPSKRGQKARAEARAAHVRGEAPLGGLECWNGASGGFCD